MYYVCFVSSLDFSRLVAAFNHHRSSQPQQTQTKHPHLEFTTKRKTIKRREATETKPPIKYPLNHPQMTYKSPINHLEHNPKQQPNQKQKPKNKKPPTLTKTEKISQKKSQKALLKSSV